MVRSYGGIWAQSGEKNELSPTKGTIIKPGARQMRAGVMEWKMQTFFKLQSCHGHTEKDQERKCGDI